MRFLVRDRDAKFSRGFDEVFRSEGGEVLVTPVRAPKANAYAERWVRTVRADCLDWLLIVGRGHLEQVLRVYVKHYNEHRPHRALRLEAPDPPAGLAVVGEDQTGWVRRRDLLGGLVNEYHASCMNALCAPFRVWAGRRRLVCGLTASSGEAVSAGLRRSEAAASSPAAVEEAHADPNGSGGVRSAAAWVRWRRRRSAAAPAPARTTAPRASRRAGAAIRRRAERVIRPGRASRVRRRVLATTGSPRAPRPMAATQRSRLWARVAITSQAALAGNLPEGQCRSPAPSLRSRMASSTTAWRR